MLVCQCNVISEQDVENVVRTLLQADPWQVIVPAKVYRELGKRGRCCACVPNIVDIIIAVTENHHLQNAGNSPALSTVRARLAAMREKRRRGWNEGRSTGHRAA